MEKSHFDYEPDLLTYEGKEIRICFDVEHAKEERIPAEGGEPVEVDVILAYCVRMLQPITRSRIIDAIVSAAYPNDVMQAVINNYLLEPDNPERIEQFNTMQAWRAEAKSVATEVLSVIDSNK